METTLQKHDLASDDQLKQLTMKIKELEKERDSLAKVCDMKSVQFSKVLRFNRKYVEENKLLIKEVEELKKHAIKKDAETQTKTALVMEHGAQVKIGGLQFYFGEIGK